jgi:hypothetical protein
VRILLVHHVAIVVGVVGSHLGFALPFRFLLLQPLRSLRLALDSGKRRIRFQVVDRIWGSGLEGSSLLAIFERDRKGSTLGHGLKLLKNADIRHYTQFLEE